MIVRHVLIGMMVFQLGCVDDAPRDNPLDPLSPGFAKIGTLTGRIIIAEQTTGIAGAMVSLLNSEEVAVTDALGYFSFSHLPEGSNRFICTKENFSADTFTVDIRSQQSAFVVRELNGAPVAVSMSILTRKIDQYFPSPQYFVEIAADVVDPNSFNDITAVWFAVDTLLYPMTYSPTAKNFLVTLYKYEIPTNTIQYLVGRPLTIVCRDTNNAMSVSAPFSVTRVIEQTATVIPSNADSLKTSFDLKWSPPDVTFNYSYTVTLSQVNGGVQNVWRTYTGINSINEKLTYPYTAADTPLDAGHYVWTVTVVDEFGNYSRSKESSFTVK